MLTEQKIRTFVGKQNFLNLLGFEARERSVPMEQSMPVVSSLEMLFYYFPFTHNWVWHPPEWLQALQRSLKELYCHCKQYVFYTPSLLWR